VRGLDITNVFAHNLGTLKQSPHGGIGLQRGNKTFVDFDHLQYVEASLVKSDIEPACASEETQRPHAGSMFSLQPGGEPFSEKVWPACFTSDAKEIQD
jgi:hypothetical protein